MNEMSDIIDNKKRKLHLGLWFKLAFFYNECVAQPKAINKGELTDMRININFT